MNPLTADLLAILRRHPVVRTARVVAFDETPSGRVELKIRCRLQKGFNFQLWLHLEPASVDYAYQLFTQAPLLRWDNAPHYPKIASAPHHFHDAQNVVGVSSLCGEPAQDLPVVLAAIADWIKAQADGPTSD
jgi:hypothetical protein